MTIQQPNSFRTGPDEQGRFGLYGGRFVAETLMPLILELEQAYNDAKKDPAFKKELDLQVAVVHETAKAVQAERKVKIDYLVGTMIEIPRGALTADEIAETAQFFSFGTTDLTQTGLGMSRDEKTLYVANGFGDDVTVIGRVVGEPLGAAGRFALVGVLGTVLLVYTSPALTLLLMLAVPPIAAGTRGAFAVSAIRAAPVCGRAVRRFTSPFVCRVPSGNMTTISPSRTSSTAVRIASTSPSPRCPDCGSSTIRTRTT